MQRCTKYRMNKKVINRKRKAHYFKNKTGNKDYNEYLDNEPLVNRINIGK